MLRIAIIPGSTRPGRQSASVAAWVYENARLRRDAEFKVVDIADFNLPLFNESIPPSMGQYQKEHTIKWAEEVASYDGYVFVTPEYNHSPPAALKNALDTVYGEWNNKAAGFVSYGSAGGVRAVEQLRTVMAELQVADVRAQVILSLFTDFENFSEFKPHPRHAEDLEEMLDQVVAWSTAMKTLR